MLNTKRGTVTTILVFLVTLNVAVLIISNILANHMLQFGPWLTDAGILTFPLMYVLSSVISEVYGYTWSRRVAYYALAMNFMCAFLIKLAVLLPQPEWYDGQIFNQAIGSSWRIVLASLLAFHCGDLVKDRIFAGLKRQNRLPFYLRAIISSTFGTSVDNMVFILCAFLGVVPSSELFAMVVLGICGKIVYEALCLPLATYTVEKIQQRERVHEYASDYNGQ